MPDSENSDSTVDTTIKVFVAYDFSIGPPLTDWLKAVSDNPPASFNVNWPGNPAGRKQGAIWKDIVQPGIRESDRFLAFIDLPNANVGFEIGYALGCGKEVAWAQVGPVAHEWTNRAPLRGYLYERLKGPVIPPFSTSQISRI